jgi:hypothetical protein
MSGWYIDAADLLAEPDPGPTPWLVESLIVDQAIVASVGRWKTTKSFALLHVGIAIAAGRRAFGHFEIPTPGPVVFVNEESGRAALWRRLDALCRGCDINPSELRGRLFVAANAGVKLDQPDWLNELKRLADKVEPRLFIFDPLARMKAAKLDENKQTDMAIVIEAARALRDYAGAAVCFVHHVGHGGGNMRGSSDLESFWETRLTWEREDSRSLTVTLRSEHREAEAGPAFNYRISWDAATRSMRFDAADTVPPLDDRIVLWLRDHPDQKTEEVAKGIGIRREHVAKALARLEAAGTTQCGSSGRLDKLGRPIRDKVWSLSSRDVLSSARPPGRATDTHADAPGGSPARPTPLGVDGRNRPPVEPADLQIPPLMHGAVGAGDDAEIALHLGVHQAQLEDELDRIRRLTGVGGGGAPEGGRK